MALQAKNQLALIQQFLTLFIYFFQNCITKK